jgi:hypothetical protein
MFGVVAHERAENVAGAALGGRGQRPHLERIPTEVRLGRKTPRTSSCLYTADRLHKQQTGPGSKFLLQTRLD